MIDRDCRLPAPKPNAAVLGEGQALICRDAIRAANLIKVGTCHDGTTCKSAIASGTEPADEGRQ